jgi:hypothetical protein
MKLQTWSCLDIALSEFLTWLRLMSRARASLATCGKWQPGYDLTTSPATATPAQATPAAGIVEAKHLRNHLYNLFKIQLLCHLEVDNERPHLTAFIQRVDSLIFVILKLSLSLQLRAIEK